MKGPALVISALVLVVNHASAGNSDPSQAPSICAQEGSDSTLVAHEDCHKFYKCYKGNPVAIDCPKNLLYNPDKEYCDWPENVKCSQAAVDEFEASKDKETKGNSDPSQAKEICAAEGSDDILVAHEECNKFYECSEGIPVTLKCPLNLLYNPDKEYCDWPWNVDCGNRTRNANQKVIVAEANPKLMLPIKSAKIPSDVEALCAEDDSEGKLTAHEDCNKFYECSGGEAVLFECPDDLLFNPDLGICDWAENVTCEPSEDNGDA